MSLHIEGNLLRWFMDRGDFKDIQLAGYPGVDPNTVETYYGTAKL